MVCEWFCQLMGSEVGPLSQRELVDMARQQQLNPEDLVRRDNSGWVPAFQVRGLFEAAAKPAPRVDRKQEQPASASANSKENPRQTSVSSTVAKNCEKSSALDSRETTKPPGADANAADDWFCIASGEKRGPLGFAELKTLANDGTLRGRDRVWRASWPKFRQAAEVDGLDVTR